ncbi:MAG: alpha/beta hydrolase [Deltaproteobacteria bacterium]|nr:alpha/beta hydrolase [Deltaproteobacteria bacterium]
MGVMFRSEAGRQKVADWHERFRAKIPVETSARRVATSLGETHVLSAGPENAPPLVALHGALASSAHMLGELGPLLDKFRVHSVDVLGQSVMSADVRPPVAGNAYGIWLSEVMDALSLPRAHVLGVSWGGFAALRLAAHAPARIDRLALLVPAGMVASPAMDGLFKVGLPMMMYRAFPSPARLERFLRHLLTTHGDDWTGYLGDAFLSYTLDMRVPPLATVEELAGFTGPALVIAADQDCQFPGAPILKRAPELLKGLKDSELLKQSNHCPPTTDEFRRWLSQRLATFLTSS